MRYLFLFTFILIGLMAQAQMQEKLKWVTIKSANLKCWECKERLDKYLVVENKANMEGGMNQWKFNLLQGEIKVQFWPDRTDESAIRAAINNAGFDADDEKANPESYVKLPPICKRAEDGGGPQPRKPCHLQPF